MFDKVTADILRSAPQVGDLDPASIPALLTWHYTQLESLRLHSEKINQTDTHLQEWTLEKIADTYEFLAVTLQDNSLKKASAFVAGTAHQIISRKKNVLHLFEHDSTMHGISRRAVSPDISAALLFLMAEQYADANEASKNIIIPDEGIYESALLTHHIKSLCSGNIIAILKLISMQNNDTYAADSIHNQAFKAMLKSLITGINHLAVNILNENVADYGLSDATNSQAIFQNICNLSSHEHHIDLLSKTSRSLYPGPYHLATLLLSVQSTLEHSRLTKISPPSGGNIDINFWQSWIRFRAKEQPYLWPNHREAISKRFYDQGTSSVLILPTGAGKTTASSLKIASSIAGGKSVIFLAPTHALVDQMTTDLQQMFPREVFEVTVGSDLDIALLSTLPELARIEVMTPERCLTLLTFSPELFSNVGLLVFDECHLLAPEQNNFRRALDGMLCILTFNKLLPQADLLFLSAMVKNGEEFSDWIEELTGRASCCINLLWKPSRQARGVVVYDYEKYANGLDQAKKMYYDPQEISKPSSINLLPHATWGLEHNWNKGEKFTINYTQISNYMHDLSLAGPNKYGQFKCTANKNEVSAQIAIEAVKNNLKVIVFVNNKNHTRSIANKISKRLPNTQMIIAQEDAKWTSLEAELGGLQYSVISKDSVALPHHSFMLKIERQIAEKSFRSENGAAVIVATPTISQGLNLPAHFVILAGDTRFNKDLRRDENLNVHELLNAAARAGRAGHLANGIVLLIPSQPLYFHSKDKVTSEIINKLNSILPDNEQCLKINDPLEIILDMVSQGNTDTLEFVYASHKLATVDDENNNSIDISKTFASFIAKKYSLENEFNAKVKIFRDIENDIFADLPGKDVRMVSFQCGIPFFVLEKLKQSIEYEKGKLPETIPKWIEWFLLWLMYHEEESQILLCDALYEINKIASGDSLLEKIEQIIPAIHLWIAGKPLSEIESLLEGQRSKKSSMPCGYARGLVLNIIPRGLVFSIGILSQLIKISDSLEHQPTLQLSVIDALSPALRLGYDTPEKLKYASTLQNRLSRVEIHEKWNEQQMQDAPDENDPSENDMSGPL